MHYLEQALTFYLHLINRFSLFAAFLNIDGGWSAWSPWSLCSATCGGGVKFRERACDSPKPSGGGADCPGPARVDHACNIESCHGEILTFRNKYLHSRVLSCNLTFEG